MNRFYDTLAAAAVILTPVAMMTSAGYSAYAATLATTGIPWLAVVAGVATALALECVGILAGELTLWLHGRNDRRWLTAALVLAIYVIAGVYVLRGTALVFLPVLAGAVYVLVGLRAQATRETAAQNGHEAAVAEWEQEQWRVKQADKTRLKLAEIEQRASTEPALSYPVLALASSNGHGPAHEPATCQHCGRGFATVQALNAHRRHCKQQAAQRGGEGE